jgi:hypothetical protein
MLIPLAFALALALAAPLTAWAQTTPAPQTYRLTGSRIAVGQDVVVERDEEVADAVVVVGGSLRVEGRVRDGILVVGGDVHLSPSADVNGDVALVGGNLTRDEGARLIGSVSHVSFGDWSRVINMRWWPGLDFGDLSRWVTLVGAFARVSLLAVLMAFVLLVARAPVARVGRAAAAEPLRAVIIGLAAEVLFLPGLLVMSIALGLTIIGLPFVALLVPGALIVAFIALILGFTALACRFGEWLEDRLGWRPQSAFLATLMGFLVIIGPTLVARLLGVAPEPVRLAAFAVLVAGVTFEFLIWTIGLGAALMTGFGRWNTAPPPLPEPSDLPVVT